MKTKCNLVQLCLLSMLLVLQLTSGAQPVTQIALKDGHSLFLKSDGSLWGMGGNGEGELGDGTNNNTNRPEQNITNGVINIAAGGGHSLFLKNDGSLWAMGLNMDGQLGNGIFSGSQPGDSSNGTNRPQLIAASNVTAIAAGEYHSLFLKNDGSLWAMGYNPDGELGDGTYNYHINQPEKIVASNVLAIAAGWYHDLLLKKDGSLWGMGANIYGNLGDGTKGNINNTNRPEQIVSSNVTAIAAGGYHSLFLKSDGSLWGMGRNREGELGDGTYGSPPFGQSVLPEQIVASNVTAIAAGYYHSLFLKSDGSLWAMGSSRFGAIGDGTTNNINQPKQIVSSGVAAIAAGSDYSLFLKSDGSLWGMGNNYNGQLGNGTSQTNAYRPVLILAAYNQISSQPLSGGNMQLYYVGIAGAKYALERSGSLSQPNWVPQITNAANSFGALMFTNTPSPATNNFWRIRSVP